MFQNESDYDIGLVLYWLRDENNLTIAEVAEALDLPPATYGRYEKKINKVPFFVAYRASVYYKMELNDFLHYKKGAKKDSTGKVEPDVDYVGSKPVKPLVGAVRKRVLMKVDAMQREIDDLRRLLGKK